jgi:hypothetical protein
MEIEDARRRGGRDKGAPLPEASVLRCEKNLMTDLEQEFTIDRSGEGKPGGRRSCLREPRITRGLSPTSIEALCDMASSFWESVVRSSAAIVSL